MTRISALALLLAMAAGPAAAQVDARLLRYPDVSARTGSPSSTAATSGWCRRAAGRRQRLSSPPGEESFPRFSPDGARIAFTGNYDGNPDVYVIPTLGGLPERVTHHPAADRMLDWYPDGPPLLFASPA